MNNKTYLAFTWSFNYFYITLILLWQVIQNYIGTDSAGRIPFFVTVLYITYSLANNRNTLFSMPLRVWWMWVFCALINTFYIQGSSMEHSLIMGFCTNTIAGPLLVSAIMQEYQKGSSFCLKYLGYVLLIYTVCALIIPQDMSDASENAHGISGLGNIVPITIVFGAFVFSVRFIRSDINRKIYFIVLGFAFAAIVISATRKAFGAVILVCIFTYLASLDKISFKTIIYTLLAGIIVYSSYEYLSTTQLFVRFSSELEKSEENIYATNWFLKLVGDRAVFYVIGWDIFLDNQWLGIGLRNFINMGFGDHTLHTEYMVQLTECGIIGSSLFLWFYTNIIFRLFKSLKTSRATTIVCFGGLAAILLISITAWTYNQPVFFVGLGVIIAFITYNNTSIYENSNC